MCFSKRRTGLFKKASDLCRLFPGVKVAAVVFSPAGKPYVYGDPTGILESQQQEQGGGSPLCALFPSPLSGDAGENTAWNSGGPLADEDIEDVIRGVQLQGGCPPQYPSPSSVLAGGGGRVICEPCCYSPIEETLNTPWEDDWLISGEDMGSMIRELQPQQGGGHAFPEYSSPPSSVLASDHLISEPCCYSPIGKETLNTPWKDDWLISGEDIGSMIPELQPQQGSGPAFPEYSSLPSSVPGDHLISGSSVQPEILREEDVGSMLEELFW
ncbi:unnamed protein product [Cuscuta europaea]|uniref:MADS-box domain-containing protein n=1 Tax=Cuscuta europaea TaxID=41803 RepID=A0A9P0ZRF4_CUSEU|nr:unnamed protein product [Cuscuta europaea]